MVLISIGIPLFLLWRIPDYVSLIGLPYMIIFTELITFQQMQVQEAKYSKTSALLCAAPYSRKEMAVSKYITVLTIFIYCCLIYWIETLIFTGLGSFNLETAFIMYAVISLLHGIYLPLYYKVGFEKTKLFFMIVIMVMAFFIPALVDSKFMASITLSHLNTPTRCVIFFIFGTLFFAFSMLLSIRIYNKSEL